MGCDLRATCVALMSGFFAPRTKIVLQLCIRVRVPKQARNSTVSPLITLADQAMSAEEPKVMKTEFRALLIKEGLPAQLVDYLESESILDATDLAFYCDSRQQIMELLIERVPQTRGQRKYLVTLAKLHEAASARNTVEAKRKAECWEDTSLEVPLGTEVVNILLDQFEQDYHWRPDESELLWDHLLGRLKREKDNDAHALIDIKRAGSALECGKSPAAKSFSIGGGLIAS